MNSMRAMMLDGKNLPFRMTVTERPVPGLGTTLMRIHASGVNPLDVKIRAGAAAHARHLLPSILGIDLAGVVEDVGADVTRFRCGDDGGTAAAAAFADQVGRGERFEARQRWRWHPRQHLWILAAWDRLKGGGVDPSTR